MDKKIINNLQGIFRAYPEIKLVYLFGSQASGKTGPLSDYDFAVYVDSRDRKELFDLKLELHSKISHALGNDKVDVVMLNTVYSPELTYNIITDGQLIYEVEPYKVIVEPQILNIYFDFYNELARYGLTKAVK